MKQTDLLSYNNYPYKPGGNAVKRALWYIVNAIVFKSALVPFYGIKNSLLRLFGARIGIED
jgi:putative colanic acid biosynthesis acetyltransferase WcaF